MPIGTARDLVYARSQGWCEVAVPGWCYGRAGNWHHRRTPGRVWVPSNGLHVCGSGTTGCHGWIGDHPALSVERGWALRSHQDPLTEPAWIRGARWRKLTDDGLYLPVTDRDPPSRLPGRGIS